MKKTKFRKYNVVVVEETHIERTVTALDPQDAIKKVRDFYGYKVDIDDVWTIR